MKKREAKEISQNAVHNIPAYRFFLRDNGINPNLFEAMYFEKIPIMDKRNYINKYDIFSRLNPNSIISTIHASSGSSGNVNYWFRTFEHEKIGIKVHKFIFDEVFQLNSNKRTLVVICFAMGVWIAGGYTNECFRGMIQLGYNLDIITPGIDRKDVEDILLNIAPKYKQVIIVGYPPFLINILGVKKKYFTAKQKVRILTAGAAFSEHWRNFIIKKIQQPKNIASVINIYGSADVGIIGYETIKTIKLRNKLINNIDFRKKTVPEFLPSHSLFEFKKCSVYIEQINNELVITADTASPLIRYNIHDVGLIKKISNMSDEIIILMGRSDVAVTFYAINIYPEHILSSLKDKDIEPLLSGEIFISNPGHSSGKFDKLMIDIELCKSQKISNAIKKKLVNAITNGLAQYSSEYRKLREKLGKKVLPRVTIYEYGEKNIRSYKKGMYISKNKKPKIII